MIETGTGLDFFTCWLKLFLFGETSKMSSTYCGRSNPFGNGVDKCAIPFFVSSRRFRLTLAETGIVLPLKLKCKPLL